MPEAILKAQIRNIKGKQAAKQLRREDLIPAILYGVGEEPEKLTVELKNLLILLHTFGRNAVVNLSVGNSKKKINAFIYEIQHDPISGDIIHVDLKHISLKEKIRVAVPINLEGNPEGVKNEGGIVEHVMHTLEIISLPSEIPNVITIDISKLHIGDVIHVKDIEHEKFEIVPEPERTIVHIIAPKIVVVPVEEEMPTEEEEATEPEVIGEEE